MPDDEEENHSKLKADYFGWERAMPFTRVVNELLYSLRRVRGEIERPPPTFTGKMMKKTCGKQIRRGKEFYFMSAFLAATFELV